MATFTETFGIEKPQSALDFVDVELDTDQPLFIDPLALAQRLDPWSRRSHELVVTFFQGVIDALRAGDEETAESLLLNLQEPNETRLGLSRGRPQGAGIGRGQAQQLYEALDASTAVQTGFINSLEDCELMIPGIGHDKISDLTTNIIRSQLIAYTQAQCELFGVPLQNTALPPQFDADNMTWVAQFADVPRANGRAVVLVPKGIVRWKPEYSAPSYYNHYVLEFLQDEHLRTNSALVRTLRSGARYVTKKDLKERFPFSKEFLFEFSREHPEVLDRYREDIARLERRDQVGAVYDAEDDRTTAETLTAALRAIARGDDEASVYHSLMIGAVEFLFFPQLGFPKKEFEINEGRKRIDIVMENCARSGVFFDLPNVRNVVASYVYFECKNYSPDPANEALDQLTGRMGDRRGNVGYLCCRDFRNRDRFIQRCRDAWADRGQLVMPLDDTTVIELLEMIGAGRRNQIDPRLRQLVAEVAV
jgi:hypothetical protein